MRQFIFCLFFGLSSLGSFAEEKKENAPKKRIPVLDLSYLDRSNTDGGPLWDQYLGLSPRVQITVYKDLLLERITAWNRKVYSKEQGLPMLSMDGLRGSSMQTFRNVLYYVALLRIWRLYGDPLEFIEEAKKIVKEFSIPDYQYNSELGLSPQEYESIKVSLGKEKYYQILDRQKTIQATLQYNNRYISRDYRYYNKVVAAVGKNYISYSDFDFSKLDDLSLETFAWLRERALVELFENRKFFSFFEEAINQKLKEYKNFYINYEKAAIYVLKKGALEGVSREFVSFGLDRDFDGLKNLEPVAMGLVTTGSDRKNQKSLAKYNTPDGRYDVFGWRANYKSGEGSVMPGLLQLSYRGIDSQGIKNAFFSFSGRGFHGTASYGGNHFGSHTSRGSHGCIRLSHDHESYGKTFVGVSDILWAAVNPKNFNNVDMRETVSRTEESIMQRELVWEMRKRIEVWVFSDAENGGMRPPLGVNSFHEKISKKLGKSLNDLLVDLGTRPGSGPDKIGPHDGQFYIWDSDLRQEFLKTDQRPIPRNSRKSSYSGSYRST